MASKYIDLIETFRICSGDYLGLIWVQQSIYVWICSGENVGQIGNTCFCLWVCLIPVLNATWYHNFPVNQQGTLENTGLVYCILKFRRSMNDNQF